MASATTLATPPTGRIALASFVNMFSVGTVYALSTLQVELPRLFQISHQMSFAPFAAACLGLALGVGLAPTLIIKRGSHSITAAGTALWGLSASAAGYFIAQLSFGAILGFLFFGGIGVGLTYLSVVVMVGQGLPNHPLARSAIGPLGFSSGAASCIAFRSALGFSILSAEQLGKYVMLGALLPILVAAVTFATLTNNADANSSSSFKKDGDNSTRNFFMALLFVNALPGMILFAALLPAASHYGHSNLDNSVLSPSMVALALGGLLAPSLNSSLGPRSTFVFLFCLRGAMLLAFSQFGGPQLALATLSTVLFAHGAGFSILPALVKSRQPGLTQFFTAYGYILPSWGAAGVVAAMFNAAFVPSTGNTKAASLLVGAMASFCGAALQFVPSLGAKCMDSKQGHPAGESHKTV